jgi:hypothetical protein
MAATALMRNSLLDRESTAAAMAMMTATVLKRRKRSTNIAVLIDLTCRPWPHECGTQQCYFKSSSFRVSE